MRKLLFFGLMLVFLLSSVSALEFDNVKDNYNEKEEEIEIKNSFG